MGYIHAIKTPDNTTHLIEPLLYATASGTADALTATISNFTLVTGAYVHVKVGNVNTNATLNVNNTGAKSIYYKNTNIASGQLTADNIYTFVYDGTNWSLLGDITGKDILIGTTAEWQSHNTYVAPAGTVIIYTDRGTYTSNNTTITVPGIKIANGVNAIIDQPFVGDDVAAAIRSEINTHINNSDIHITSSERTFWNNKLNCNVNGEILQFNQQ